jgi:hypothetical protein
MQSNALYFLCLNYRNTDKIRSIFIRLDHHENIWFVIDGITYDMTFKRETQGRIIINDVCSQKAIIDYYKTLLKIRESFILSGSIK